jgi:hypothetical protein
MIPWMITLALAQSDGGAIGGIGRSQPPPPPLPTLAQGAVVGRVAPLEGRPKAIAALPDGWLLVTGETLTLVTSAGRVVRTAEAPVGPDALAVDGGTLWWGTRRLGGGPVEIDLKNLLPVRPIDPMDYELEPFYDVFGARPPEEPFALSSDGATWARGEALLVLGRRGEAPQPYDLGPYLDPARRGEPPTERPPEPAPAEPDEPTAQAEAEAEAVGMFGILGAFDATDLSGLFEPIDGTFGDGFGGIGGLGGISSLGDTPREPKQYAGHHLSAVAVSRTTVAFCFEQRWTQGSSGWTDRRCGVLDPSRQEVRLFIEEPTGEHLVLSPDGAVIAAPLSYAELGVWGPRGALLARLPSPRGALLALAISPDGQRLAAGSDRALALYAARGDTWTQVAHVDTQQGGVRALAFGAATLGVLGGDGSAVVLELARVGGM